MKLSNPGCAVAVILLLVSASQATAHVSEQGLALLLPTDFYITSGVLAVIASIILISVTPKALVARIFRPLALPGSEGPAWIADVTSLVSMAVFFALVYVGFSGPRDPLTNLFPLVIWVGFWIILFSTIGLTTNLWRYLNPWTGFYTVLFGRDHSGLLSLPQRLGAWPGLAIFAAFCCFYIADPAPLDPDRLAAIVLLYWVFTLLAMIAFGATCWMTRGEAFSILFDLMSRVGCLGHSRKRAVGLPGWDLLSTTPMPLSLALFSIVILGVGSFDGLKETFWWLGLIGINPLEFPGRSYVISSSLVGLGASCIGLIAVFAATMWLGEKLANMDATAKQTVGVGTLIRRFAPTVLPIALAYHMSHFLITFLVDGQYLLAAIGDPLANGSNLFGLGQIRVTTGFLNTPDSVKAIWLTQASIVVAGHILAVMVAHHVALDVFANTRRAILSQIPIAAFMIAYTFFGLWLLAAPRGI